jgi:hypothetical protein
VRQLDRIESLHPPELPATAAVFGDAIKGTLCLTHTKSLDYKMTAQLNNWINLMLYRDSI